MDVEEDYEMMRTRSTDDDNAILEDLEIGEYQDMEMNEMYGINESSRGAVSYTHLTLPTKA